MKKFFVLAMLVSAAACAAQTKPKTLLNVDKTGIAIQGYGYDPVAYFTHGRAVKGHAEFESSYHGARYLFANAEDKAIFEANPAKYEPQFGGYCAYGASEGHSAPISPDAFMIVNGRLLLQYDQGVTKLFAKDVQGRLKKADEN